MNLSAKDFEFHVTDGFTLAGCPLGEDDYFAAYGHNWSDADMYRMARTYLAEVAGFTDADIEYAFEYRTIRRIEAGVIDYGEGEWGLTILEDGLETKNDRVPVTIISL